MMISIYEGFYIYLIHMGPFVFVLICESSSHTKAMDLAMSVSEIIVQNMLSEIKIRLVS